jgi:hypothetical protein
VKIPKGTVMYQWVNPKQGVGRYFSYETVKPEKLGIYSGGRELKKFRVTGDVQVLRSTAAKIDDTWSLPGKVIPCEGGNTQVFVNNKALFEALD